MLWTVIQAGNLGSPQNATWKRGIFLQFETNDTTRYTGISDMPFKEYTAMKQIITKVPYWGSNELHWSEVGNFLKGAISSAEKIAPMVSGILSLF